MNRIEYWDDEGNKVWVCFFGWVLFDVCDEWEIFVGGIGFVWVMVYKGVF